MSLFEQVNGKRSKSYGDEDDDSVGIVDCFPGCCYDRCYFPWPYLYSKELKVH